MSFDNVSMPESIAQHTLTLLGVTMTVHVLDDGRRVFEADPMDRILTLLNNGEELTAEESTALREAMGYD